MFDPYRVFHVLENLKYHVKNDGTLPDFYTDYNIFKAMPKYIKDNCKRIAIDLNSKIYTVSELKLFILYRYLFIKNIILNKLTDTNIIKSGKLFKKERLERDKIFIIELNKELKLYNIEDFFKLNEDGITVMYKLVKAKEISPMFCVFYSKYFKNVGVQSIEHKHFIKIINLMKFEFNIH